MTPTPPVLDYVATIEVEVSPTIEIGTTAQGIRRVAPIRGGRVVGPGISGKLFDAGADFQRYPTSDLAYLDANYVLELDDGHRILVENQAIRSADPADLNRMMVGETVDPSRVYFRCVPSLSADDSGPHAWMNRTLFLGTGERLASGVRIEVFRVR
ncbi:DUF3237 family protein [Paeniglutamicibacter gangotriensis]|uniref:UPF0311 protein FQ154_01980 n=1 Tax=Paeniglutamicibacter gangotriensis TaxID=254787 RepID=A0A5B0EKJ3_9MICC|nr:DUF3237 family protein [Paeniglutamicibacter gangotriensis]KAA0979228.1 DUF3237 family protein [Paeniglutamicibacter gangotriensis]